MNKWKMLLVASLVVGLGFAGKANAVTDVDFTFETSGAGTAEWISEAAVNAAITGTPNVVGEWAVKLTNTSAASYSAFEFVPNGTVTLADFQIDITNATPAYSFEYLFEHSLNGPQFELTFEEPNGTGWLEITAVGLQGATASSAWQTELLAGATLAGYGGNTPDGSSVFNWGPLTALSGIEAAVNASFTAAQTGASASTYVLTLVQVELWEDEAKVCYVDDIVINGTTYAVDDPVMNTRLSETYVSIQDAIDAATAGDVIQVPAGTYDSESFPITISTEVSLLGPNEGIDPNTGTRVAEATIYGSSIVEIITVQADDVLIDGFTIQNIFSASQNGDGVLIKANTTGATVQNNIITLNSAKGVWGVMLTYDDYSPTLIVTDATVSNNKFTGYWGGVYVQGCALNTEISDNVITGVKEGINLGGGTTADKTKGTSITGNTITGSGMYGISIEECSESTQDLYEDLLIENNTITGSILNGIHIYANCGIITGLVINYNNISGNTNYGIENLNGVEYNAKYNWWGNVSGPYHATSNPTGEGDSVSNDVTYVPWYDDSVAVGGATGGIPTGLTIQASPTSAQTGDVVTITDTLKDVHGNPVYGKRIDYSLDGVGTVLPVFDTTDGYGYATTYFNAGTHTGTGTVRAELSGSPSIYATVPIVVAPGPVDSVKVTPAYDTVVVADAVTIEAELLDAYGNHIDADTSMIGFAKGAAAGSLGIKLLTADSTIQIVYTTDTMKTMPGCDTIIATDSGSVDTDTSFIYTVGGPVAKDSLAITLSDDEIVVRDDSTITLIFSILAKDKYGNPTENREITFGLRGVGDKGEVDAACTTDVSGAAGGLEYYPGTEAQVVCLTATATDAYAKAQATATDTIYLEADTGCAQIDSIAITAGSDTIYIGEVDTLTFTYFDEFGNPVNILYDTPPDTTFDNLTAIGTLGAAIPDTIDTTTAILYRELVYGVQLKKSYSGVDTITVAKVDTIIATANDSTVVDTFLMTVVPVGEAAYFTVTFPLVQDTLTVDNAVTLTITAFDADSNRIYSYGEDTIATEITLTHTGTADSLMWTGDSVVDDGDGTGTIYDTIFGDGQAIVYLTNRKAETLTASVAETGKLAAGTSDTITWIPDALEHFGIVAQTEPIYTGVPFTFTVTPYDTFHNVTSLGLPVWIEFSPNELGVTLPTGPQQFAATTAYPATATNPSDSLQLTVVTTDGAIFGVSDPITVIGLYTLSGTVELSDNPSDLSGSKVMVSGGFFDSTDVLGHYAIPELLEGTYNIIVTHEGYQTEFETGVDISANTTMNFMLEFIVGIEEIPAVSFLSQNKPNPFAGGTTIEYGITKAGNVEIVVYNVVGQKVRTLVSAEEKAGYHKAKWDGTNDSGAKVGGGIYFYKITAGEFTSLKKLILLR